ncbi:VgrG-related protein [Salidesulfovibrio brasiliensis]
MSIGIKSAIDAVQRLGTQSLGVGQAKPSPKVSPELNQAFEQQMNMAKNLFGETNTEMGGGANFDSGMINDVMMFDALAVISRLMQQQGSTAQQAVAISAAAPQIQAPQGGMNMQAVQNAVKAATSAPNVNGSLSAQFESGSKGIAAIGWDSVGGTSYGKYQIAAKTGSMDSFLNYLDDKAPDIAERLRSAGPAETGGKSGAMPAEWQRIAAQQPERFEELQHGFIKGEYYDTARQKVLGQTGIDIDNAPPIVQEVLWSTSVQHGPTGAAGIFSKAINAFLGRAQGGEFSRKLIENVYDTRKGQFGSSTERVQEAVGNRLESEKEIALNMLSSMQVNRVV